jgi:L-threonylcarbamoyladenylate synthase
MGRIWPWREEAAEEFWTEARKLLLGGSVIAMPTDTFYALAANPFQEAALSRVFALKGRPPEKPVLVLVDGPAMLKQLAREVPNPARRLMEKFWPGPLTIVFPGLAHLPRLLTAGTGTVGVRQPRHVLTCRLISALGFPITGTSANRSGRPPLTRADEVDREFGAEVGLILEAGECPGGKPSTIVDMSRMPARLVRSGAFSALQLAAVVPEMAAISKMGDFR